MSTTLSIGKVCAIASTALLMGGYVWHQSRNGEAPVVADTTTGQAIAPAVVPGSHPEVLPGSKSTQMVLPGSKDALVFDPSQFQVLPGSKSDSIDLLPGSKSGRVVLPSQITVDEKVVVPQPKPAKNQRRVREVFSGSKDSAPLISPPDKKAAPTKPKLLPGSKSLAYIIPVPVPVPNPRPKVLPGSKSFAPINPLPLPKKRQLVPAPAPKPNPPTKSEQASTPTPSPTPLGFRAPLPKKHNSEELKLYLADQEARLRKELEARKRLEQKEKQNNDQARPE